MEGQEAKRMRESLGITQEEVSRDIDVSVITVYRWEKTHAPKLLQYYFEKKKTARQLAA